MAVEITNPIFLNREMGFFIGVETRMSWNKACKYFKDAQQEFERERMSNLPAPEPDAETVPGN